MSTLFAIGTRHGNVTRYHVADPKLEAYKYMAWLARMDRRYSLRVEDGAYTVECAGLETVRFAV